MKKLLTIIFLCLVSSHLFSQSSAGTFTILMGGSVGKFNVDAGSNFNSVYSNRKLVYTGVFGLGNGSVFVIGKYRVFNATGQSTLTNIAATGSADWKQSILLTGLRFGPGGSALYFDALYVFNHAEENIATENPTVDALSTSQTINQNGFAFAAGLAPKIAGPLDLDFEVEYSFMSQKSTIANGSTAPDLGGMYYSAGISFYFSN
ncbi:MAG: hypothetical protein WBW71_06610 [Bacteroidota bacterium]